MLPPHELKNKEFTHSIRGYNPVEVDDYIRYLIDNYTMLYRENDELDRKLKSTVMKLEELKRDEDSIRSTLVDAKRAAARIKADAEERADSIIRSAKSSCNAILADFNAKIDEGREALAEMQRDALELRQELFSRYSQHIEYIDKLTEGINAESIPEPSELRRAAVRELKENLSALYDKQPVKEEPAADYANQPEPSERFAAEDEEASEASGDPASVETDEDTIDSVWESFAEKDAEERALEVERKPLDAKQPQGGIKESVKELAKLYRENEDVINTPDSDTGEDVTFDQFFSQTQKQPEVQSKEQDFDMLFGESKSSKKRKKR